MNLILFLLLALTASRTGLVQCKEGETEEEESNPGGSGDEQDQANPDSGQTPYSNVNNTNIELSAETDQEEDPENLISVLMIIIPLLLTLVIITVVVCVVIMYRRGRKVAGTKEDPYLDHEDHEKVPMPMFDDDVPSVMELEMEDLENWISKDGGKKMDTGQI